MYKIFGIIMYLTGRFWNKLQMLVYRPLFKSYGQSFIFEPKGSFFSFQTITVGDDVYIGPGAKFIATDSFIKIGNKVMFGPDVTIMGGDHNTSVIGRFMRDIHEKRKEDDQGVIIHDDVWVGTRAVILKGVEIGRGTIIAAGAVVTKNVPPYSVAGGIPAKILKWRWTVEDVLKHEEMLYPATERYSKAELEQQRREYTV